MKKAPSTSSAMVILAVFLFLGVSVMPSFACQDCQCFSDNTCSDVECASNLTANCTRSEFTPACTGTYIIRTETRCSGGGSNCTLCYSCANIFKLTGGTEIFLANGHTNACGFGGCVATVYPTVNLIAGSTYVIYTCKLPCSQTGATCESCSANCTAYACISYNTVLCTNDSHNNMH